MKYRQIINFGIFAHIDAGKTTLTERILFQEKVISSLGDVESGTTETDFLEEEISRGISIQSVVVRFEKKFQNTKILCNLIDTPGHLDFDEQVEEALEVIDIAILVVDVNNTIQSQTEVLWEKLNRKNIPIIIFINKIDSTEFDLLKKISEIKKGLSKKIYPAFFLKQNSNQKMESILKAKKADENILIPFIEWNEKLSEKYLQSPENIQSIALEGLQKGFHIREVFPLLIGSAKTGNGVGDLIDLVCFLGEVFHRAKKNEDESAIIFKKQIHPEFGKIYYLKAIKEIHRNDVLYSSYGEIGFNQIFFIQSLSIEEESEVEEGDIFLAILSIDVPKNIILYNKEKKNLENKQKDRESAGQFGIVVEPKSTNNSFDLNNSLKELTWEDDSFSLKFQRITSQIELWGQGELHLEIGLSRLRKRIGEIFSTGELKVARYEIWKNVAEKHVFFHSIKEGMESSGEITVFLEKSNDLIRSVFFEENVPEEIREPIRDGFEEIMSHGNFGEEILGVKLRVISYDKPSEFNNPILSLLKVAVISGLKSCIKGKTELIGSLSSFEIVVPDFSLGKVLAELGSRSAKILKICEEDFQVCRVTGEVSTENLLGFTASLRNMTKGKGIFHSKVNFSISQYSVIEIK